jgi:hypothetical protein
MTETKRFKGWGAEELCEVWGIPVEPWETHKERLAVYMHEAMSWDENDHTKKVAADLREFLGVLADEEEHIGFYAPLWRGLIAIEHDSTMLKIAAKLVDHMWS